MLRNLKNTWRNIKKQRVTSIINISGLAIGMAAAVLIFLWVQNELTYDNYHSGSDRIYRVKNYLKVSSGETWIWENSPLLLAEEVKKHVPEVEVATKVMPVFWGALHLKVNNQIFAEPACAYIDEHWFDVFRYKFLEGSAGSFNQHPFSMILTESKAKSFFGKGQALGKIVSIDSVPYTVKGIIQDNPLNSSFQFDVLMPVASKLTTPADKKNESNWGNFNYLTFLRLAPGASTKTVAQKTKAVLRKERDKDNLQTGLIPLSNIHFESNLQGSALQHGNRNTVYVFTILGFLILLIACINYVNLTTAKASLRMKEVSIKKIVGAERKHLLLQFIGESALMSFLSLVISLVLIVILLPVFNRLTDKNFALDFTSPMLWYITGGALISGILLTSIYPAIVLSSFKPIQIFRGQGFLRVRDSALRKALVVLQFTFSIALIIGVLVVTRQLDYIQKQDNGYYRSQVMSFSVSWKLMNSVGYEKGASMLQSMKQSLLAHSSIDEVSVMNKNSIVNMKDLNAGSTDWDGRDPEFNPSIAYFRVDEDFKNIVSLQIVKGRWFERGATNDQHNVLLNETAVKELGIREPVIGQRFYSSRDSGVIIGVVKDFHYRSMHDKIMPMVIKKTDLYSSNFLIKTAPGQLAAAATVTKKIWEQFWPGEILTFNYLDEEFDKLYQSDRKASLLVNLFATIAVIISCLGLFGLAAFTAERRTKEIGIRKVLGAGVPGIVQLLSREFVILVAIAFVLASPVAWYGMNAWLQDFAYRIDISWWIFAIAGISSITIALVTVCFQAIKAALANPVKSLRTE
jgi:putative ABC transport system permease protein